MKLKLNKSQQRLPLGGHHYPEPGKMVKGETFDEVVRDLEQFRVMNGIPVGEPKNEVLAYYGRKYPWMVLIDEDDSIPVAKPEKYEVWRDWIIKTWTRAAKKHVTRKEATLRWETCEECPFNQAKDWPSNNESQEMQRRAFLMARGEYIPKKMQFCALHGFDIGVASFVETPSEVSDKKKDCADYPECWVSSLDGR